MITLTPGHLTLPQLRRIAREPVQLRLDPASFAKIDAGAKAVADIAAKGEPAYGINTGFGRLASTHIPHDQLELLQKNLVLSHAVGVGEPMARSSVRLLMALKLSSLGRGHSGIRREVMDALITLFNADVLPLIPVKGSVGASGDLAPLAHMSAVLLGVGEVFIRGERASALDGLRVAGLAPLTLQAKEGLALLNGTQASTALALDNMFAIEDLYRTALVAGALSVDAAAGSVKPFDARIHELRGHQGQIDAAASYRELLEGSPINQSHRDCDKVQDPYSLRCQPQVMGACLDQMRHAADVLLVEANAVSDNPLIFPDTGEVLSGGNFHAEPVAFAADNLALAAAEIGALAERRIALLIDATLSGLPPFLVKDGGVNSGFMIAHVTAAALASENKTLAHPASVDSLPTSANQEDHVSMATFAARKLADIADNTKHILAIELLAAAQGVDLRAPYHTSPKLAPVMETIRGKVAHYELDHYFAPDIAVIAKLVGERAFAKVAPFSFASEQ
ncbi:MULTISPECIES: histidine ammonia-lyase [Burkholderia cepacia complex]|uniref:histidine ammonia-lyase n=1 Tax=Burkholderia cepacia complex TaxID=87882 RepID=UPI001B9EA99B|nr:histidine ammonia-lyase [Burkholderia cenocepacia]MBR8071369.1 histidine ammonia-lyase [Burkholderia cenocepacia]MBR8318364.1 histidine ammonia-lyase [Burkholderia cenocepacia]MBR8446821.1 histidine ammonia-lyase [Burkholderia cenocepacia]